MDSSAWIGFSILAIVLLLLGYVRKASLAHSKRLTKQFKKLLADNKLNTVEMVSWDNGIFGLDVAKSMIVFVQENYHVIDSNVIQLNNIETCELIHERLPSATKILLSINLKDKSDQPVSICFYNSATDILANMGDLKEKAKNVEEIIARYRTQINKESK